MAIAIDGASPAVADDDSTTVTTASFTRPASGLLVAMVAALSADAPVVSGGGLTWTRRVERSVDGPWVEIWTAPVTGSGAMTVTLTITSSLGVVAGAIKVDAVTGQHASPIGNSGNNASTANTLSVTGYTSSVAGSRGFFVAVEDNSLGAVTVAGGDNGFPFTATHAFGDFYGIAIRKAANTPTSGSAVSFSADATGTDPADWTWAALEIKPASTDASVETTTVATAATVPGVVATASASPVPATTATTTTVPDAAISAGSTTHPDTVPVITSVPDPSVTTENTEVVEPATIAATADVPAPQLAVSSNATLATIAAVLQLYAPTIQADAHVTLSPVAVAAAVPAIMATVPVLPGDAITQPGQIEWNGFLLGSLTPYSWQELTGWIDSAPWISGNVDRPDSSGSYPGQPYSGERVINWGMLIKAPRDQIGQAVHDLIMATGPAQTEDEDWLVIWDFDDIQPRLVRAFLSDRKPGPIDRRARLGLMHGGLQWTASDPRRYDPVRSSLTIAKDVQTSILNDGNDATPGELRFPGPATGVQVENLTNDRVIAFDTVIAEGQTLVVEVTDGRVFIGETDHLHDLVQGSTSVKDFVFDPGANELLYTADTGGSAGMETFWRHAIS
ncbi:hypothetical protein ACIBKY_52030 [Nonomuraea sp. NPDC050394]|uniref:hypothetical protein n=1 Tax=Nonomuraea sp. NPDC050394 TaxID=3364363 RepID=UPI0037A756AF